MADALINGDFDFYTGEYIGRGKGMPRTLDGSLPWERRSPTPLKQQVDISTIERWFNGRGIKKHDRTEVILEYIKFKGWVMGKKRKYTKACIEIQKDIPGFETWFNGFYHAV